MELVPCPACENPCSPQAESCPSCGHPFKNKVEVNKVEIVDRCYKCDQPATQKCVHCDALSCVKHLSSHNSRYGKILLCDKCGEKQNNWNIVAYIVVFLIIIIYMMIMASR